MVKILITQTFWIDDDKLEMFSETEGVKKFSEINFDPNHWQINTVENIERGCSDKLITNCIVRKIDGE